VEQLDRLSMDLKMKLDETTVAYETSVRDLRNKQTELTRVSHELDKSRDQKEALSRENKKLTGRKTSVITLRTNLKIDLNYKKLLYFKCGFRGSRNRLFRY